MSLSAFAFLFPYMLLHNGEVSAVSVISSMIVVYPAQIFLILCWLASLFSFCGLHILDYVFASLIYDLSEFISGVAHFMGNLKFSHFTADFGDLGLAVFLGMTVVSAFALGAKHRGLVIHSFVVSLSVAATVFFLCW